MNTVGCKRGLVLCLKALYPVREGGRRLSDPILTELREPVGPRK